MLVLYKGMLVMDGNVLIFMFVGVIFGRVCVIMLLNEFLCRFFSNVIICNFLDIMIFGVVY